MNFKQLDYLYIILYFFRSLQRSHSNSLPRNVPSATTSPAFQATSDLNPPPPPPNGAESFQDISLQSLQWLESRGLYGGKSATGMTTTAI